MLVILVMLRLLMSRHLMLYLVHLMHYHMHIWRISRLAALLCLQLLILIHEILVLSVKIRQHSSTKIWHPIEVHVWEHIGNTVHSVATKGVDTRCDAGDIADDTIGWI
jgi:hypothetical protein